MCARNGRDFLDFARYFLLSGAVLSFAEVGKVRMGDEAKRKEKEGRGGGKYLVEGRIKFHITTPFFSAGKKNLPFSRNNEVRNVLATVSLKPNLNRLLHQLRKWRISRGAYQA